MLNHFPTANIVMVLSDEHFGGFLDDIHVLIIQAKEGASDVNATASDAITRMQNITEELNKINISSQDSNLNDLLDGVNKTCESSQF